ncbi:MAG: hypothetical protein QM765_36035 [Myxococcales bacterium]
MEGIDGVAANDVWFVGTFGAALHWNGTKLERVDSGTGAFLEAVKAFGANEVWAVGFGGPTLASVVRWDGASWTSQGHSQGTSLWGAGPDDVWVDRFYHWDGAVWTTDLSGGLSSFTSLWGTASDDVWFFELGRSLFHFDGAGWRKTEAPDGYGRSGVSAIAGTSRNDVWAGSGDRFLHWDGASWQAAPKPSSQPLTALFSRGEDVWALFSNEVYRRGASGWELVLTLPDGEFAERMWTDGTEFWFGRPGLLHWDGASFTSFQQSFESQRSTSSRTWGSARAMWRVLGNHAARWNGSEWEEYDLSSMGESFSSVGGSGPDDVWAVGSGGAIARWDGGSMVQG